MVRRKRNQTEVRDKEAVEQLPWAPLQNRLPPTEILSADEIEHIHQTSLRVLSEVGMVFHDPAARDILARAGCDVDQGSMNVRFDPVFVEEQLAKAPSSFSVRAPNPERNLTFGGNVINITSIVGPVYSSDLDRGRCLGTMEAARDYVRLTQSLNAIHIVYGFPFTVMDVPPEVAHLEASFNAIELTDKLSPAWLLGRYRAEDALDIACLQYETDREGLRARPACIGNINTNSPLILDIEMCQGAMAFAECGQPVVVTPFTLAGAMAPATLSGALVGQNAEALACIALFQTINPGTPCMYGSFTSNVDMRSGFPAFGTPEYAMGVFASGQLARRHGLPFRSSNCGNANMVDAQAAYESSMAVWPTVMSHCNMIIGGAGWLEGGLTASFEKLIIDAEMYQMMSYMLQPPDMSDGAMGLETFREVGAGGHFFDASDTLDRYKTAFYSSMVSNLDIYENWQENGSPSSAQNANRVWKRLLETYEQPDVNPDLLKDLRAFVDRRTQEIRSAA